ARCPPPIAVIGRNRCRAALPANIAKSCLDRPGGTNVAKSRRTGMSRRLVAATLVLVSSLLPGDPSYAQCAPQAKFALMQIYSNADGSVQFLELAPVVT